MLRKYQHKSIIFGNFLSFDILGKVIGKIRCFEDIFCEVNPAATSFMM